MSSLNKVTLIGRLGQDPDVKTMQSGGKLVNLSLATSEKWKDKQTGEIKEKTEWHRIVIFNEGLIGIAERYLNKGSKIYIEGKLQTRKWSDNGVDRYSTEVVLQRYQGSIIMLGSRGDNEAGGGRESGSSEHKEASKNNESSCDPEKDFDDEIPF